jgi:proteasome lid subunit RPN8/RPN11
MIDLADPTHTDQMFDPLRRVQRIWNVAILPSMQDVLIHVCKANKTETCGFISKAGKFHVVNNVHEEKMRNFLMDEASFHTVIDKIYNEDEDEILGVWHTHPTNIVWPSPRDLAGWPNPDLNWKYWIVTNNEVIEWELV